VIFERLFRFVGQLGECVQRDMTGDFQPDQSLNLFLSFVDAERDTAQLGKGNPARPRQFLGGTPHHANGCPNDPGPVTISLPAAPNQRPNDPKPGCGAKRLSAEFRTRKRCTSATSRHSRAHPARPLNWSGGQEVPSSNLGAPMMTKLLQQLLFWRDSEEFRSA
jgi:hypothetical protein